MTKEVRNLEIRTKRQLPVAFDIRISDLISHSSFGLWGAWQFRWDFSLGGVTYLSSWGNIWFQRPLRWRVASARKASSPLRLQNWPVSLKRRWYWEQVDSIAPEPTGWPRAFPLL